MSKQQTASTPKLSASELSDVVHGLAIGAHSDHKISMEEAFDIFEKMDDSQLETLGGAEYWDWSKAKEGTYVFLFTGITSWKGTDQRTGDAREVPAVQLTDKDGKEWICAGKLLVDNCSPIQVMPCLIRIVYAGRKKANNGNQYFDLKVQVGSSSLNPGK